MPTLTEIKAALNITGDYQDATLQIYMDDVMGFLEEAGVNPANVSAGLVARGVADLWNYGAGDGRLSTYFRQRAAQLSYK
jgi:hypothetical protein